MRRLNEAERLHLTKLGKALSRGACTSLASVAFNQYKFTFAIAQPWPTLHKSVTEVVALEVVRGERDTDVAQYTRATSRSRS